MITKLLVIGCVISMTALASPVPSPNARPLMWTGITGKIRAFGLNDPQYILSFVPVQRLMLEAVEHPLTTTQIDERLNGLPVTLADLVRVGLLRADGSVYRLNYLLFTAKDAVQVDAVGARYGASLAQAFLAQKDAFDEILASYPSQHLRDALLFDLVAGVSLNWEGLKVTTELGYRATPARQSDGSEYFVHSQQLGAQINDDGLYEDSETAEGKKISFTTFGDGASIPRLKGLPDMFDGVDAAVRVWRQTPSLYRPLKVVYLSYTNAALDDAAEIMDAIDTGTNTTGALATSLRIPDERLLQLLDLLEACGYVSETRGKLTNQVPFLGLDNREMVQRTIALSRSIMAGWLKANYGSLKVELAGLSPMRNGVSFDLVFSEVWHAVFGHATKILAESGFYADPRNKTSEYPGYMPLVWNNRVMEGP